MTLLDLSANKTVGIISHKCEKHLPHFTKKQIYEIMVAAFTCIYQNQTCAYLPYFRLAWNNEQSIIEFGKVPIFKTCSWCYCLRETFHDSATQ